MEAAAEQVRVVGVAILAPGPGGARVLAAQRRGPGPDGGGWELPGGKCHPGEPLEAAAVREIDEELGCTVRVTGRLDRVEPIRPGLTLEVVLAELVGGEPVPFEHAELRWLGPDELEQVRWLPADVPFLAELSPWLRPEEDP
jgi:8-oxo-dGTP diphosphatase